MISETMKEVLKAIATELMKSVPDLHRNVTAASLGIQGEAFRAAVWRLQKEGYIADARFVTSSNHDYPVNVLLGGAVLTQRGHAEVDGQQSPVRTNVTNISIADGSSVGVINTGHAGNIHSTIDALREENHCDLADALQSFTESLMQNGSLTDDAKGDIIQHLSHISGQLGAPKDNVNKAVARTVLDAVSKVVGTAVGLVSLWDRLHLLLKPALGL